MKNSKAIFFLSAAFFLVLISCKSSEKLFLKNSNQWEVRGDAAWSFSNNTLVGKINNGEGLAVSNKNYKNFILELDFKPDSTINSGVYIRCEKELISAVNCYEINIWDASPNQDYRTGAIVLYTAPLAKVETINAWNTYKIKAENKRIQIWVNNILTTDIIDEKLTAGYIALQAKGSGEVSFRNIRIKPLD